MLALAVVSQVGGQGLMAVGLSVVPPVFGALVFFLEVVSAAALGWLVLGEQLGLLQYCGAALIVLGLVLARRAPARFRNPACREGRRGAPPCCRLPVSGKPAGPARPAPIPSYSQPC